MKIFISWSGTRSHQVAQLLQGWINQVIQATKPWISSDGIDRGEPWFSAITSQLGESMMGIFCLTRENLNAPWILFEAGAVCKGSSAARVCTFLVDLEQNAVKPPLGQFNHTKADRGDMLKLMKTINLQLGELGLADAALVKSFDRNWAEFEEAFTKILASTKQGAAPAEPSDRDLMKEVLEQTRGIVSLLREEREQGFEFPARSMVRTGRTRTLLDVKRTISQLLPVLSMDDIVRNLIKDGFSAGMINKAMQDLASQPVAPTAFDEIAALAPTSGTPVP